MSLQVELCEHLARNLFHAAERTKEPSDSQVTSQARGSVGAGCAGSIEAVESGEAHTPELEGYLVPSAGKRCFVHCCRAVSNDHQVESKRPLSLRNTPTMGYPLDSVQGRASPPARPRPEQTPRHERRGLEVEV